MNNSRILLQVAVISIVLIALEIPFYRMYEGWVFLSLVGLLWLGYQIVRYRQFTFSRALIIGAAVAIYVVLMIPFSYSLPLNLITVFRTLLLIFLSILIYNSLVDETSRFVWENSLILVGVFAGIVSLIEVFTWFGRYSRVLPQLQELSALPYSFRVSGFMFDHPNTLAGYMNFIWPIMLVRMLTSKPRVERLLWLAGIILCALTIYFGISRGGLIGALAGTIYLSFKPIFKYVSSRTPSKEPNPFHHRQSLRQVLVVSILLVLFSITVLWRAIESGQLNLAGIGSSQFITLIDSFSSGRGTLWMYSWKAFLESPIYGHGNAGFPIAYSRAANLPPGFFAPSAHNLWLDALVEYGVIGFVFFNSIIVLFFVQLTRYLSKTTTPMLRYTDAYVAGVLAFLAHQFFDSMLRVSNYTASLLIILMLLTRYTFCFKEWKISSKLYLFLSMAFLIPLFLIIFSMSTHITSFSNYQNLAKKLELGEEQSFQTGICALAERYPSNALYHFQCSMVYVYDLSESESGVLDQYALRYALQHQQIGYALDPYWPIQETNLAVLYWLNGDHDKALAHMRHAAAEAPRNAMIWINLGWMEEQLGNSASALESYNHALRHSPPLAKSVYIQNLRLFPEISIALREWMTTEEQWDRWYETEILDKDFLRGLIALFLGETALGLQYFNDSRDRFEPTYVGFYAYYAYAKQINGDHESAYRIAQDIALLDRERIQSLEDPILLSLIGSILRSNGQMDEAYRLFLKSYRTQNQVSEIFYYPTVHGQLMATNDLSPLLIRSFSILTDTQDDWEWFVQQAQQREDELSANRILRWKNQLNGLDRLLVER